MNGWMDRWMDDIVTWCDDLRDPWVICPFLNFLNHHQLSTCLTFGFATVTKHICHWSSSNSYLDPPHLSCFGFKAICIMPLTFLSFIKAQIKCDPFLCNWWGLWFMSTQNNPDLWIWRGSNSHRNLTLQKPPNVDVLCHLLFSLKIAQTSLTKLYNLRLFRHNNNSNFHLILLATESCGTLERCVWCRYKSATNLPGHETVLTEASIRQEK